MSSTYHNILLTIIALLLVAIVAKLYLPAAQNVGAQISPPTRGELITALKIADPKLRRARFDELRSRTPTAWISGGEIEVTGEVEVTNTVEIEGDVSIDQHRRDLLNGSR